MSAPLKPAGRATDVRAVRRIPSTAVLALLAIAVLAGAGLTWAAFAGTTSTSGSTFAAGDVRLADDDEGAALYDVSGLDPGESVSRCVRVEFTGNLGSDVAVTIPTALSGEAATALRIRLEEGRSTTARTFPGCGTYDVEAELFEGSLAAFSALSTGPSVTPSGGGGTVWDGGDAALIRATISLPASAPATAKGTQTAAHALRFRATLRP